VGDADVPGVCEAVQRAAAASQSLAMSVAECGCFPERGPVRIVWAATAEPSGRLAGCVEATERELESLGFAREARAFSPHITIGRVREDRSRGAIRAAVEAFGLAEAEAVEQDVLSLTLMSSVLSPNGPTYSAASRAKLGA
jgi:2'-5' RNA ligase